MITTPTLILFGLVSLGLGVGLPAAMRLLISTKTSLIDKLIAAGVISLAVCFYLLVAVWYLDISPPLARTPNESHDPIAMWGGEMIAIIKPSPETTYFVVKTGLEEMPLVAIRSVGIGEPEFSVGDQLTEINGELNGNPNQLLPVVHPRRITKAAPSSSSESINQGHVL